MSSPARGGTGAPFLPAAELSFDNLSLVAGKGDGTLHWWQPAAAAAFAVSCGAEMPGCWPPPFVADPEDDQPYMVWYLVEKTPDGKHGHLAGVATLKRHPEPGSVQFGCSVVSDFQGRGYATLALRALTQWALRQHSVQRVFCDVPTAHPFAASMLTKAGYHLIEERLRGMLRFRCNATEKSVSA